jgi:tellurite resistance protein TerC
MEHTGTPVLYAVFSLLVVALLAMDFLLLRTQGNHRISVREAALWSVGWVAIAVMFGGWMWWYLNGLHGEQLANRKVLEYFTGYVLEKGLAIENVFVWITIFSYFAVPAEMQKRVLLWGVVGAILMRAVLIYLGAVLIHEFSWMFYVFGAVLLVTGMKMTLVTGQKPDLDNNFLLNWLRARLPLTANMHGESFWVKQNGIWMATPLLLVLVLVEISDLIFALDSIPAIFAVTGDPFIVFTANTFAILGLRAMYFLLADMADRFHLLGYGLGVIVVMVGVKMLIADFIKVPIPLMLGTVLFILIVSIVASLMTRPRLNPDAPRA